MRSVRYGIRAGVCAAVCAGSIVLSAASVSAAPAFDPNGDGAVTVNEVLDAALVPVAAVPGGAAFDRNGDGALSIGEVAETARVGLEGRIPTPPRRCTVIDDELVCRG